MEQERRKREVIDAVDLAGNVDLLLVVGVNLDESFQAPLRALFLNAFNQTEGLRDHEAGGACFLSSISDCIKADRRNMACAQLVKD